MAVLGLHGDQAIAGIDVDLLEDLEGPGSRNGHALVVSKKRRKGVGIILRFTVFYSNSSLKSLIFWKKKCVQTIEKD